jgi:hypothetical protein
MLKNIILGMCAVAFLPAVAMAEFTVSEYKYQKDLISSDDKAGYFSFPVDEQIYEQGNQFFSDFRVADKNNTEIPYFIKKESDFTQSKSHDKKLDIISQSQGAYVLDMGKTPAYHNSIDVQTESFDFSRAVNAYGSHLPDARFEYLSLNKRGDLLAVVPGNDDTSIDFKYTDYRYIKLVFAGEEGDFTPVNFTVKKTETWKEEGKKEESFLQMEILDSLDPKKQKVLFTTKGVNIPVDSLVLHTIDSDFSRNITLYSSNSKDAKILENNERYNKSQTYWKSLYKGNFYGQVYLEEQVFDVNDNKKYYLAVIDNGDNPQLVIDGATATRFLDIVYVNDLDFTKNTYKVFYANTSALKPKYDISVFQKNKKETSEADLEKQENNVLYTAPKEKLGEDKPYVIYIFIVTLAGILFWFVYKIMKEIKNKDDKEEVDIIEKL